MSHTRRFPRGVDIVLRSNFDHEYPLRCDVARTRMGWDGTVYPLGRSMRHSPTRFGDQSRLGEFTFRLRKPSSCRSCSFSTASSPPSPPLYQPHKPSRQAGTKLRLYRYQMSLKKKCSILPSIVHRSIFVFIREDDPYLIQGQHIEENLTPGGRNETRLASSENFSPQATYLECANEERMNGELDEGP